MGYDYKLCPEGSRALARGKGKRVLEMNRVWKGNGGPGTESARCLMAGNGRLAGGHRLDYGHFVAGRHYYALDEKHRLPRSQMACSQSKTRGGPRNPSSTRVGPAVLCLCGRCRFLVMR